MLDVNALWTKKCVSIVQLAMAHPILAIINQVRRYHHLRAESRPKLVMSLPSPFLRTVSCSPCLFSSSRSRYMGTHTQTTFAVMKINDETAIAILTRLVCFAGNYSDNCS